MGLGGLFNTDVALSHAADAEEIAHRQRAAVYKDREALIHAALIWDLCGLRVKLTRFKTRFWGDALETASHLLSEVLSNAERAREARGEAVAAAEAAGFNVTVGGILESTDRQMLECMKTSNREIGLIIENSRRPLLRYLRHLDYDLSDLVGTKEPNSAAGLRACGIDVEDGASCLDFTIRGYEWRFKMYVYLLRRASFAIDTGKLWHNRVSRIYWEPVPTLSMLLESLALCCE